ncbi:hypothetical protein CPB83DRAFT_846362 [Crepidotus variabilis]|uniref:Cyclin N-terminal domain-containing protein n=1 Tax=Crepidotus variabilis TaxID=179855 RepID=A0A9P6EP46_9AGAR|nr:hypothetical protein CPB83DRAFT_846362 [Crepidotus variabilis]
MASPTSSSSSSSSSPSSVHKFSLVDPQTHSPALLQLIDVKISRQVVEYAVDIIVDTVDYALGRPSSSKPARRPEHSQFTQFVASMLERAEVTMPTLLVSLVYVQRAKPHLHIGLEQWALERVFLGALIVASKYLNDSTLKNVHWSMCTGIFGKRDIGRIEREYLDVLNFELRVSEDDVLSHHQGLAAAAHLPPSPRHSPKSAIRQISEPEPAHEFTERRHSSTSSSSRRHHRRRDSPPQHLPELDPDSPTSSSSSSDHSSLFGPRTPESMDTSPAPAPTHPQAVKAAPPRKVLGLDASHFQGRTIENIIRRFPQIPRMHT